MFNQASKFSHGYLNSKKLAITGLQTKGFVVERKLQRSSLTTAEIYTTDRVTLSQRINYRG